MSNKTPQIVWVGIDKIKPNPNNPRTIRDEKFKNLVKSIKEFPEMLAIRTIVVNDKGMVLGGNRRYDAAVEAGMTEVPVIYAKLNKKQEREFILRDNASAGEWDWDELLKQYTPDEIKFSGIDLPKLTDDGLNIQSPKVIFSGNEQSWFLNIEFKSEEQAQTWYNKLVQQGLIVKIIQ